MVLVIFYLKNRILACVVVVVAVVVVAVAPVFVCFCIKLRDQI